MEYECVEPDCGRKFAKKQGLNMHLARSHRPPPSLAVDDMFERLGQATDILFPNPPASRYMEIAEWQKATLKFMERS